MRGRIIDAEIERFDTKNGKGLRLVVKVETDSEVVETSYIGAYIPHSNSAEAIVKAEQTEQIGRKNLERLLEACGVNEAFQSYSQIIGSSIEFEMQERLWQNVTKFEINQKTIKGV